MVLCSSMSDENKQAEHQTATAAGNLVGSVLAGSVLGALVGAGVSELSQVDPIQAALVKPEISLDDSKPLLADVRTTEAGQNVANLLQHLSPEERVASGVLMTDHVNSTFEQIWEQAKLLKSNVRDGLVQLVSPEKQVSEFGTGVDSGTGTILNFKDVAGLHDAIASVTDPNIKSQLEQWVATHPAGDLTQTVTKLFVPQTPPEAPTLSQEAIDALRDAGQSAGTYKGTTNVDDLMKFDNIRAYSVNVPEGDRMVEKTMLVDKNTYDPDKLIALLQQKGVDLPRDISLEDGVKWGTITGGVLGAHQANEANKRAALDNEIYQRITTADAPSQQEIVAQSLFIQRAARQQQAIRERAAAEQEASWQARIGNGEMREAPHQQSGWQGKVQPHDAQSQGWQHTTAKAAQNHTAEAGEKKWGATVNTETAKSHSGISV